MLVCFRNCKRERTYINVVYFDQLIDPFTGKNNLFRQLNIFSRQKTFFPLVTEKCENTEKDYFNQPRACKANVCWPKYTTINDSIQILLLSDTQGFAPHASANLLSECMTSFIVAQKYQIKMQYPKVTCSVVRVNVPKWNISDTLFQTNPMELLFKVFGRLNPIID